MKNVYATSGACIFMQHALHIMLNEKLCSLYLCNMRCMCNCFLLLHTLWIILCNMRICSRLKPRRETKNIILNLEIKSLLSYCNIFDYYNRKIQTENYSFYYSSKAKHTLYSDFIFFYFFETQKNFLFFTLHSKKITFCT